MTARLRGREGGVLVAITLLGALLRFHDLGLAPLFTDNADELQFAWAGIGMLLHGDAYTWSYYPAYLSVGVLQGYGTAFPMVHHWLDHPPLFSLVMGSEALLFGDSSYLLQDPAHLRILPALCATATIPLAWAIAREAGLGAGASLAGALLLATGPGAVLMGREAEPESIQAPLMMAALLIGGRQARSARASRPALAALALICLLEPLFKVSGAAVGGMVAVIFMMRGRLAPAFLCAGASGLGLAIYAAYGWAVDWQLFQAVIHAQARNRTGVLTAFEFIAEPSGINRRLRDGWWILGWIGIGGMVALGRRSRAEALVAFPVAAYVATMLVLAGTETTVQYGWYKVMVYPLVYLAAGVLCWRLVAVPSASRALLVLCLGGAVATNFWLGGPGQDWVPDPWLASVLLAAVLLPAAAAVARRFAGYEWAGRYAAIGALAFIALGNAVTSFWMADLFQRF